MRPLFAAAAVALVAASCLWSGIPGDLAYRAVAAIVSIFLGAA